MFIGFRAKRWRVLRWVIDKGAASQDTVFALPRRTGFSREGVGQLDTFACSETPCSRLKPVLRSIVRRPQGNIPRKLPSKTTGAEVLSGSSGLEPTATLRLQPTANAASSGYCQRLPHPTPTHSYPPTPPTSQRVVARRFSPLLHSKSALAAWKKAVNDVTGTGYDPLCTGYDPPCRRLIFAVT